MVVRCHANHRQKIVCVCVVCPSAAGCCLLLTTRAMTVRRVQLCGGSGCAVGHARGVAWGGGALTVKAHAGLWVARSCPPTHGRACGGGGVCLAVGRLDGRARARQICESGGHTRWRAATTTRARWEDGCVPTVCGVHTHRGDAAYKRPRAAGGSTRSSTKQPSTASAAAHRRRHAVHQQAAAPHPPARPHKRRASPATPRVAPPSKLQQRTSSLSLLLVACVPHVRDALRCLLPVWCAPLCYLL